MQSLAPFIGKMTLHDLYLMGSHDAGTFDVSNKLISHWTQDQTGTFTEQLEAGSRSFDLRIGDFGPSPSLETEFRFVHDSYKSNTL